MQAAHEETGFVRMATMASLRGAMRTCLGSGVLLGAAFAFAAFVSIAAAQAPNPPPVIEAPAAAPAAPPAAMPRIPTPAETLGAIGRFIDQSISNVGAGMKGAGDTLGGATSAAGDLAKGVGDAAGTVARLPLSNVVAGFERCAIAPNGGADCANASLALCKAKGYETGASVDITTSRKCPAQVWLQGRQPTDAECTNEAFVSKAICR